MKRITAAMLLVLSLAACGDNGQPASKDKAAPAPAADTSGRTPSPPGAKVFLIEPKDGATVKNPITVKFGVEGMEIVPAGTDKPNSGHHHLLVDTKLDDYNAPIPADENHIHYGKGQTEAQIELKPGKHTLQDVFADKNHIPHDPPVQSDVITITVE
jgi:predicted small lipoprotein YifL